MPANQPALLQSAMVLSLIGLSPAYTVIERKKEQLVATILPGTIKQQYPIQAA